MTKETNILQNCRKDAYKYDLTLFRNNCGSLEDKTGRWVQFGVGGTGGSDLIGWHNKTGQFVAVEVKMPGKEATEEQLNFIKAVRSAGGIAGVVTSPDELADLT